MNDEFPYAGLETEDDADAWATALRGPLPADTVTHESGSEPTLGAVLAIAAATPAATEPEQETRMYSRSFWMAAGERAVKTFAQTMVAALGVGATGVINLDFAGLAALAASAAVASILTSLAGLSGPQADAKADDQG